MGNSGKEPKRASESCFVADEDFGRLDVPYQIVANGQVVAVSIKTTRYVGSVDEKGFLVAPKWEAAVERGTLARTLLLTIRAKIHSADPGQFEIEVFLHKGTGAPHEVSLGKLNGASDLGWKDFELDVPVEHVRFPDDPCGNPG